MGVSTGPRPLGWHLDPQSRDAGRKLTDLRAEQIAGVYVADLVHAREATFARGPFRLSPDVAVDGNDIAALRVYVVAHRRSDAPGASDSWLGPFLAALPPWSTTALLAGLDAALERRLGRGVTVEELVAELRREPRDEVKLLLRAAHDVGVPLSDCQEVILRAARSEFGLLRGLVHGVLLVRAALPPGDGFEVLSRLGEQDDALVRMLAHAVLLRVVTRRRTPRVRDLIYRIADFERERHRGEFLTPDLGCISAIARLSDVPEDLGSQLPGPHPFVRAPCYSLPVIRPRKRSRSAVTRSEGRPRYSPALRGS